MEFLFFVQRCVLLFDLFFDFRLSQPSDDVAPVDRLANFNHQFCNLTVGGRLDVSNIPGIDEHSGTFNGDGNSAKHGPGECRKADHTTRQIRQPGSTRATSSLG